MGFRSMMVTGDYAVEWPAWFVEKHSGWVHFPTSREHIADGVPMGPISSKHERKFYGSAEEDVIQDIAKVVRAARASDSYDWTFEVVLLHECGGITKYDIRKDRIDVMRPVGWEKLEYWDLGHDYCYRCSELRPADSASPSPVD